MTRRSKTSSPSCRPFRPTSRIGSPDGCNPNSCPSRMGAPIRPVPRPAERIGRRGPGRLGCGSNDRSRSGQDVKSRASARFLGAVSPATRGSSGPSAGDIPNLHPQPQTPGSTIQAREPSTPVYSVRISRDHRAVGILQDAGSSGAGSGTTKTTTVGSPTHPSTIRAAQKPDSSTHVHLMH